ncbi:hypothetical protein OG900_03900 [Streptomyces sp. NBC_00433]
MIGWLPRAQIPSGRPVGPGNRTQPASYRRDQAFLIALWQILVSMGTPFVPPPVYDDDPDDAYDAGGGSGGSGRSGAR